MKRNRHNYKDFKERFTREEFDLMMEIQNLIIKRNNIQKRLHKLMERLKILEEHG
ncbi:hypothetical protein [uncultured Bacteroides sp.]|uniref:hypothetical protein n=1 Tax=uncultured Bacteroides sp. TaxID=162156 RepID=UPI0025B67D42|nr:hypothetical protein [uncultured Bacteroides sp.]